MNNVSVSVFHTDKFHIFRSSIRSPVVFQDFCGNLVPHITPLFDLGEIRALTSADIALKITNQSFSPIQLSTPALGSLWVEYQDGGS